MLSSWTENTSFLAKNEGLQHQPKSDMNLQTVDFFLFLFRFLVEFVELDALYIISM